MSNNEECRTQSDLIGFLALVNGKLILPFEELFRGELTNLQLLALVALRSDGEMPVTALADRLYITKQQMTKIISKLEADGHVHRKRHPSDGRVTLVRLTDETDALLAERHERFIEAAGRTIERHYCKRDARIFSQAIGELTRILSALPDHALDCVGTRKSENAPSD